MQGRRPVTRPLLQALRKAPRLSIGDWGRVAIGFRALQRAIRDVKDRPQGEFVTRADGSTTTADPGRLPEARAIALGVSRAAAYGPLHPTCLAQSLAIQRCLQDKGIEGGRIRVGVARQRGKFVAHAWVEFAGEVIGDDRASVDRYEPFDDMHVKPSGS